jgi:hypothetical protein
MMRDMVVDHDRPGGISKRLSVAHFFRRQLSVQVHCTTLSKKMRADFSLGKKEENQRVRLPRAFDRVLALPRLSRMYSFQPTEAQNTGQWEVQDVTPLFAKRACRSCVTIVFDSTALSSHFWFVF